MGWGADNGSRVRVLRVRGCGTGLGAMAEGKNGHIGRGSDGDMVGMGARVQNQRASWGQKSRVHGTVWPREMGPRATGLG